LGDLLFASLFVSLESSLTVVKRKDALLVS